MARTNDQVDHAVAADDLAVELLTRAAQRWRSPSSPCIATTEAARFMQGIEANMTEREVPTDEDKADGGANPEDERAALARAVREFDAAQARIEQNAERVYDEKRRGLVLELLPVLDNLDRTLEASKPTSDAALVEGVRIVRSELEGVLTRYGVERVDALGLRFDPKLHEAVAAVPVQDPALVGTVVRQSAPGYRFGDRVLRAAKVSVGVQSTLGSGRAPGISVPMPADTASFVRLRHG